MEEKKQGIRKEKSVEYRREQTEWKRNKEKKPVVLYKRNDKIAFKTQTTKWVYSCGSFFSLVRLEVQLIWEGHLQLVYATQIENRFVVFICFHCGVYSARVQYSCFKYYLSFYLIYTTQILYLQDFVYLCPF